MKSVYLDNNTTTMIDPAVLKEMQPYMSKYYGDALSPHFLGKESRQALETSMQKIYAGIDTNKEDDIIITSGATESNNWVLKSIYMDEIITGKKNHIIVSEVEDPSILSAAKWIEEMGAKVTYLKVDDNGMIDAEEVRKAMTDKTALVSVMWANPYSGALFPVAEIGEICEAFEVPFHTDASQAIGKTPVSTQALHVDFMSFTAHTFHGPKGTGALYIKKGRKLTPLLHAGKEMGGLRGGTLNIHGIVGMGKAMEHASDALDFEIPEVRELRDELEEALQSLPGISIQTPKYRLPNTLSFKIHGIDSEAIAWYLNEAGIALYVSSACLDQDRSTANTLSIALSRYTTEEEIGYTIQTVKDTIKKLSKVSPHIDPKKGL